MKEKHLGTILVLVTALVIFFYFYRNDYLLYAAILLGCIGIFIPWLSRKLHWLWMKFAELLGAVMNKVILSVVFFVFLVPMALLRKLFGKKSFSGKKATSNFTERNFTYTKKSMEDLW